MGPLTRKVILSLAALVCFASVASLSGEFLDGDRLTSKRSNSVRLSWYMAREKYVVGEYVSGWAVLTNESRKAIKVRGLGQLTGALEFVVLDSVGRRLPRRTALTEGPANSLILEGNKRIVAPFELSVEFGNVPAALLGELPRFEVGEYKLVLTLDEWVSDTCSFSVVPTNEPEIYNFLSTQARSNWDLWKVRQILRDYPNSKYTPNLLSMLFVELSGSVEPRDVKTLRDQANAYIASYYWHPFSATALGFYLPAYEAVESRRTDRAQASRAVAFELKEMAHQYGDLLFGDYIETLLNAPLP